MLIFILSGHKSNMNCYTKVFLKKTRNLGGLKEITLGEAKKVKMHHIAVVPGKKICPSCRIVIPKKLKETMAEDKEELQDGSHDSEIDETELSFQSDVSKEQLNSTLSEKDRCFSLKNPCY